MKETIYTIPISEVFEPKEGCPLCTLAAELEERWVQYITGAAMMEPDIRIQTNEKGFCAHHLTKMLEQRNRLSVALLLQTWMDHLLVNLDNPPAPTGWGKKRREESPTCFVCERIDNEMHRLADNLVTVWAREDSFRTLYSQQEFLCRPHHGLLVYAGQTKLRGNDRAGFLIATNDLLRQGLEPAKTAIDAFCKLFDYRSNTGEKPSEQVSSAVERAAAALCGQEFPLEGNP